MKNNQVFKVGDKIVNFGKVYKIFKIKKTDVKEEKIIQFTSYFEGKSTRTLVFSIPLDNLDKTNIRKPISKKELGQLLKALCQKPEAGTEFDISKAKEKLSLNNPYESVEILKCLWKDKNDNQTTFTKSKQEIFELAIDRLLEEVALVGNCSLEEAKQKIKKALS